MAKSVYKFNLHIFQQILLYSDRFPENFTRKLFRFENSKLRFPSSSVPYQIVCQNQTKSSKIEMHMIEYVNISGGESSKKKTRSRKSIMHTM